MGLEVPETYEDFVQIFDEPINLSLNELMVIRELSRISINSSMEYLFGISWTKFMPIGSVLVGFFDKKTKNILELAPKAMPLEILTIHRWWFERFSRFESLANKPNSRI